MPLQKLQFRPGVNREGTTLANEGGWFECDKVRFRSGYPEKIGGWAAQSFSTFLGTCRSLWTWITLTSYNLLGVGTNLKFYVEDIGGNYYDITPIKATTTGTTTFAAVTTSPYSSIVTVTDTGASGLQVGDFVTFSLATGLGGNVTATVLNQQYQITALVSSTKYTILTTVTSNASDTGNGGGSVKAAYQVNTGKDIYTIGTGWGAGPWSPTIDIALGSNPIATTSGSGTITVTQTGHGYTTTATSFVVGQEYRITTTGTTDFTLIGAANSTPGTFFSATGAGLGTGTASIAYVNISGAVNTGGNVSKTISGVSGTGSVGSCAVGVGANAISLILNGVVGTTSVSNVSKSATNTGAFSITLIGVTGTTSISKLIASSTNSDINGIPAQLINGTQYITVVNANTYTFLTNGNTGSVTAKVTGSAGGSSVIVEPQYPYGASLSSTVTRGWGDGFTTGIGLQLRLWSQANFGEILLFAPRGGAIYSWAPGAGTTPAYTTRGTAITGTEVPSQVNQVMVSDSSRICIAFGATSFSTDSPANTFDPMLIRWSTNENYGNWLPSATNQAGSTRLSRGSFIMGAIQTRQEILVWTDSAVYSMQYLGVPYVFGFTILADNISIISPNAMATANGVTYWMGTDKFYVYSGRVETLPCALRAYVFDNINQSQAFQCFAGTNEAYSEIWWFYCSITGPDGTGTVSNPNTVVDRYVIFNYLDRVWYYGTLNRTAWQDSPLRTYPQAATGDNLLVYHEATVDDNSTNTPQPIYSYIQSSDFDIGDGHNYGFVWQIVPDITFDGSTTPTPNYPNVNFIVRPRQNPGAAYGTADTPNVASTVSYATQQTYNVQQFTELVNTRVRGRQMAFKIESNSVGTQWQLGTPRINVRPDGRR
jgi:hypothetical protein